MAPAVTVAPPVYAAAPVAAAPATTIVTGVDMNRDGIPDILQGGAYGSFRPAMAPVMTAAPAPVMASSPVTVAPPVYAAAPAVTMPTMAPAMAMPAMAMPAATTMVTGVDMNRDGIPDVLQRG